MEGDFKAALRGLEENISIHALRVEGDGATVLYWSKVIIFLSTPSGWRATSAVKERLDEIPISIHALRVEGDGRTCHVFVAQSWISIHALRVEGDYGATLKNGMVAEISIHALRVEGDLLALPPLSR